ncbi:S-layer homology domain-containing protein [Thermosynechococcaceae cyanobacterium BACA0444]|uniref:S-layer homology domain-containing protein n=1 Tax=Pseudocalidococcus azoricus BACA0444 TaxID=2918990 RepID=A0AAE4FUJ2_9CYAN|nr:S-layer homology domain-containing protein [Pseudocalidococcus azoricus]MDS3861467.1 S-layer homology domain-containing protein [Pseudocalidococcus azoricus BACA0444]
MSFPLSRWIFLKITPILVVTSLAGCAGNQAWEQAFSADPNTQTWNEASPAPLKLPPELQFPQASLIKTLPLDNGQSETHWQTSQPPLAIQGFYQQQLTQLGWQLQPPETVGTQLILQAQKDTDQLRLTLNPPTNNGTEFTIQFGPGQPAPNPTNSPTSPTPTPQASPADLPPQTFTDLAQAPATLQPALQDLAELGVITGSSQNPQQFAPNQPITRGTYARWLVTAHNRFYADRPARQIRLGSPNDKPLFNDVPKTNPDFPYIQGLAAAGYLPSPLTGSVTPLFRPNAPLTRETLLQWKVPLDVQRNLTTTAVDRIEQTWGFKDSNRITPEALSATAADFQNGDLSNIRRIFGATLLLQPQKPVTRAEAAASLWYMGNQAGDGLSAQDILGKTTAPSSN